MEFNSYSAWSSFYEEYKKEHKFRFLVPKQLDRTDVIYSFNYRVRDNAEVDPLVANDLLSEGVSVGFFLEGREYWGYCQSVHNFEINDIQLIEEVNKNNDVWTFKLFSNDRMLFVGDFCHNLNTIETMKRYLPQIKVWFENGIEDVY